MWKSLFERRKGASYPQQQCYFCATTSVILPPYDPNATLDSQPGRTISQEIRPASRASHLASSSDLTISTGSPSNWYCSSCQCQNTLTADGKPVDQYTRPMWDEAWNRDRSRLMKHTKPSSLRASPSLGSGAKTSLRQDNIPPFSNDQFTFCHTCRTNQTLQVNMMADYLPDEDDPEYKTKLERLPSYQASIAVRYPAVCADCAPHVQQRIQERDQYARSWSLGKWLDLKQKVSRGDLRGSLEGSQSPSNGLLARSSAASHREIDGLSGPTGSIVRRAVANSSDSLFYLNLANFGVVNALVWCIYLEALLRPASFFVFVSEGPKRALEDHPTLFGIAFCLGAVGLWNLMGKASQFDPTQRRAVKARARNIRPKILGLRLWLQQQRMNLYVRRLILMLIASTTIMPNASARIGREVSTLVRSSADRESWICSIAAAVLALEVIGTAISGLRIRFVMPPELRLVSKPVVGGYSEGSLAQQHGLLSGLSLDEMPSHVNVSGQSAQHSSDGQNFDQDMWMSNGVTTDPRLREDKDTIMEDATSSRRDHSQGSIDSDEDLAACAFTGRSNGWTSSQAELNPSNAGKSTAAHDFQLGPQRFWEPQNPTGLEDVFGKAVRLEGDEEQSRKRDKKGKTENWSKWLGFSQ